MKSNLPAAIIAVLLLVQCISIAQEPAENEEVDTSPQFHERDGELYRVILSEDMLMDIERADVRFYVANCDIASERSGQILAQAKKVVFDRSTLSLKFCDNLLQSQTLESLEFQDCPTLSDQHLSKIHAARSLSSLEFGFCRSVSGAFIAHLRTDIRYSHIGIRYAEKLEFPSLTADKKTPTVTCIDMHGSLLMTDAKLKHLLDIVSGIEKLVLDGTSVTKESIRMAGAAQVTSIALSGGLQLDQDAISVLCEFRWRSVDISDLDLRTTSLAEYIAKNKLERIRISRCNISDNILATIAASEAIHVELDDIKDVVGSAHLLPLACSKQRETLIIRGLKLSKDPDGEWMRSSSLKHLTVVACNWFTSAHLERALSNSALIEFHVYGVNLDDFSGARVKWGAALRSLSFMGMTKADDLISGIVNSSVKKLRLRSVDLVSAKTWDVLTKSKLEWIEIGFDESITDETIKSLAGIQSLKILILTLCPNIKRDVVLEIAKVNSQLRILVN